MMKYITRRHCYRFEGHLRVDTEVFTKQTANLGYLCRFDNNDEICIIRGAFSPIDVAGIRTNQHVADADLVEHGY